MYNKLNEYRKRVINYAEHSARDEYFKSYYNEACLDFVIEACTLQIKFIDSFKSIAISLLVIDTIKQANDNYYKNFQKKVKKEIQFYREIQKF